MQAERQSRERTSVQNALKALVSEVAEGMAKSSALLKASRELKKMRLTKEGMIGARAALMELDYVSPKSNGKWWRSADCLEGMREGVLEELAVERDFGESGPLIDGAKIALDVVARVVASGERAKKTGPDLRARLLPE